MWKNLLLLLLLANHSLGVGQIGVGKWRDHYSFRALIAVATTPNRIYAASANGVFWYSPADGHIGKYTTVNGLNDVGITTIAYSASTEILAVGYENGNIDLVLNDRVVNLPFIKQKMMQGSKQINHFFFDDKGELFVSTAFGIVVINLSKFEIKDTYFIASGGAECWVHQTTIYNNRVYAATDRGLLSADINNSLLIHFESWSVESAIPSVSAEYNSLAVFADKLIANQSTGGTTPDVVWVYDGFDWTTLNTQFTQVRNLWANTNQLVISSRQGITVYQAVPGTPSTVTDYGNQPSFHPNFTVVDNDNNLVVADEFLSLMLNQSGRWRSVSPNGPFNNRAYYVMPTNDELYILGGARSSAWGNLYYPLTYHKFLNNQWSSVLNFDFTDAVRITASPLNPNEFFISSWGHGIIMYRDGQVHDVYGPENSSLQTIIPGPYCRIGGVVFDSKGNLWASNVGVPNPISMRTPDGSWTSFPYDNIISSQRISDIVLSPRGHLWVIIPSGGGLFALNPGDNPTSMSSHTARKVNLTSPEGESLPSDISSIAFDKDGYLWVGTSEGVLVSYNPHRVFESSEFSIQRVKIPNEVEGFAAYLLSTQTISAIAVDGGNRKWFGTQRSGVYLQSADGSQQIHHFTQENSPLPSNTIYHIGVHPKTGEVFFATDRGTVSYRDVATEPNSRFGKVYAFPNPVRPNFEGPITITGLVDKTNVKITDVSGNLVYEITSVGGQATWDGKNLHGNRVATGVYLFFCADSEGSETAVGKILFVK